MAQNFDQNEEIIEDQFDMAQNLPLFDLMPDLTESDYDSDADSIPSLTDSDSGLDDSMVSLIGDNEEEDNYEPHDLSSDLDENNCEDMERNINIVMARATVTKGAAEEALRFSNGDILDAIRELCPDRDPTMPLLTESDVSTDISDAEDEEYDLTSDDEKEERDNKMVDSSQQILKQTMMNLVRMIDLS